jgi:hypothetical protein
MSHLLTAGFNFRATLGAATDGAREYWVEGDAIGIHVYPYDFAGDGEIIGGWVTANPGNEGDHTSPPDRRVAGWCGKFNGSVPAVFQLDLARAGRHRLLLGMGYQPLYGISDQEVELYDDDALIASIHPAGIIAAGNIADVLGNVDTVANWLASPTYLTHIFQSKILNVVVGSGPGQSDTTLINHLFVQELVDAGSGTTVVIDEEPIEVTAEGDLVTISIHDEVTLVSVADDEVAVTVTEEPIEVTVTEEGETVVVEVTEVEQVPDRTTLLDDVGGGVTYVGKAAPGSATSEAVWQIQKITEGQLFDTGDDLKVEWAGSNANFDKVWDDRLGLSYG